MKKIKLFENFDNDRANENVVSKANKKAQNLINKYLKTKNFTKSGGFKYKSEDLDLLVYLQNGRRGTYFYVNLYFDHKKNIDAFHFRLQFPTEDGSEILNADRLIVDPDRFLDVNLELHSLFDSPEECADAVIKGLEETFEDYNSMDFEEFKREMKDKWGSKFKN